MQRHSPEERERGQAATEFAICAPILCMLLIGIVQYGQMIWTNMELTSATRDGARRAAVARVESSPVTEVTTVVNDSLDTIDPALVNVSVTGGWSQDSDVTVIATTPYTLDIMGIEMWSGNLRSSSTVRIG